ncbi:MAG: lysylphosphatidylglycerol synthase transmembrane domain-containing protein [Thermodesulfobacteriota bacterium]
MQPNTSRTVRSLLLFTVAGLLLYAVATLASDYRQIATALVNFPISDLSLVLAFVITGWLLRGWRFHYYLIQSHPEVRLGYSISVFLAGFALTGTPGKVGEAVKGVFTKRDYGIPATRVVGIVVVERLMDLLAVLVLASFSLLMFSDWRGTFAVCAGIVAAGGVTLCLESVYRPLLEGLGRISFLSKVSRWVLEVLLTGRDLMHARILVIGLVVSIVAWGLEAISMYVILQGLKLPATLLQANFVYSFSTLIGALSMLPGGIGGTELGMVGLMGFMGIAYAHAIPAVILIRLSTLWFAVIVGIGFMTGMLLRPGQGTDGMAGDSTEGLLPGAFPYKTDRSTSCEETACVLESSLTYDRRNTPPATRP